MRQNLVVIYIDILNVQRCKSELYEKEKEEIVDKIMNTNAFC